MTMTSLSETLPVPLHPPRPPHHGLFWRDDRESVIRLGQYCDVDVAAEEHIDGVISYLSASEKALWMLDQVINDRGVRLDTISIHRALGVVEIAKKRLDARMRAITGGAVEKCSQAKKLVDWINSRGIPCTSINKSEVEELKLAAVQINDKAVIDAINTRREAAKASAAKLTAMLNCVCSDGRARGQFAYHGASTGRWAGRLIQLHNLPRVDEKRDLPSVMWIINVLMPMYGDDAMLHDMIAMQLGPVLPLISKCLRAMLTASQGNALVGGDFSNVEGRVLAWLANETWKLQAFADYDAGTGIDLYILAFARSFGVDVSSVANSDRQVGKVQELALGFQGAVGALMSMCTAYGMDPGAIATTVRKNTTDDDWNTAASMAPKEIPFELTLEEWTGLRIVVDRWRAAHPGTKALWRELQDAAIEAVGAPGRPVYCAGGKIQYLFAHGFLWCRLPSGRLLAYANARLEVIHEEIIIDQITGQAYTRYDFESEEHLQALLDEGRMAVVEVSKRRAVAYDGLKKGAWRTIYLYGGLQTENIVQATARDLLVNAMMHAEREGFPLIMHVHDEIVAEVPNMFCDTARFEGIMSRLPEWAYGLPLATKAWVDFRYVK